MMDQQQASPSPTPELCEFLAATRAQDLPPTVLERTRYLLLDAVACGLVGAQLPWSQAAVDGTVNVDNGSGATLWGWGRESSALSATLLNGTFVQGFELDDFHPHGALHSGSVVVPAGLAAAEATGDVSFTDFLAALALGFETGPRVGIAMGASRVTVRGWHSGAVFGPFAAAAAAGKIFGLDAGGFESALGNAGTRAGALMAAQYKSMVKRMHHGMAAQAGLHGASLARSGFLGIERVIEHEFGGLAAVLLAGEGPADLSALTRDLGSRWDMMGIGIKRHACLIMLHSSIDAILSERSVEPANVERITIDVSESVFRRAAWAMERPGSPTAAQMNLRFAVAVALLDRAAHLPQFTAESIGRGSVWDLMDRIDVRHSSEIDALGHGRRFLTRLAVRTRDGRSLSLTGEPPQDRPFRGADVVDKFRGLVSMVAEPDRARAIENLILTGGADDTASTLAELLRPTTRPVRLGLPSADDIPPPRTTP